jgi:hypothetical protein
LGGIHAIGKERFVLRLVLLVTTLALANGWALSARAELASWDQAKVSALAKQLEGETQSLYEAFNKQPQAAAAQRTAYYRLKEDVRAARNRAKQLAGALAKGAGRDETHPIYDDLLHGVRRAREIAPQVFTGRDVQERASAVRRSLNQLAPYYDPDAPPLQAVTR